VVNHYHYINGEKVLILNEPACGGGAADSFFDAVVSESRFDNRLFLMICQIYPIMVLC
jgi:hypothetical protein